MAKIRGLPAGSQTTRKIPAIGDCQSSLPVTKHPITITILRC